MDAEGGALTAGVLVVMGLLRLGLGARVPRRPPGGAFTGVCEQALMILCLSS